MPRLSVRYTIPGCIGGNEHSFPCHKGETSTTRPSWRLFYVLVLKTNT